MASTFGSPRRKPQQSRAAARRSQFLAAGARIFSDHGYEAATMTTVAQNAKASIGALYDYFPDKQALALALLAEYAEEANVYWAEKFNQLHARTAAALAEQLVEGVLGFVAERPAYLALQNAPVIYRRVPAMRLQIRRLFATEIQRLQPKLTSRASSEL